MARLPRAAAPAGEGPIDPTDDLLRALEAAGTVFWLYDVACREFIHVSETLWATFGIPAADVASVHARIVAAVHPDDRAIVRAARVPIRDQPQLIEYRLVRPDGSVAWVSDQSLPVFDADGRVVRVAGFINNVTEQKLADQARLQGHRMESVGRLAGGIAHDFNNLLTVILTAADLLAEQIEPTPPELDQVRSAGRRAAELTRQLLDFSRRRPGAARPLDLNDLAGGIELLLRRLIGEHVVLVVSLDPRIAAVNVDPSGLEQVIVNLAVNARDAMPEGGTLTIATGERTVLRRSQDLPGLAPGHYVTLLVSDTGCGMDEETLGHAFEPFYTTKPPGRGTGLGLAQCYGIVKSVGGYISARSRPGAGSTFVVYLPAADVAAIPVRPDVPLPAAHGSGHILIVEDEPIVRANAARSLRAAGYTVTEAVDGLDGLQVAASHDGPLDLVVTDLVMPRLGGREMVIRLAERRSGFAVLYTSGYPSQADGAVPAHVPNGFLAKPYRVMDLLDHVGRMLASRPT